MVVGRGPHVVAGARQPARADRLPALLAAVDALATDPAHAPPWRGVWVEHPDTNEGKALSTIARALQSRLAAELAAAGRSDANAPCRLHVFLSDAATGTEPVWVALYEKEIDDLITMIANSTRGVA